MTCTICNHPQRHEIDKAVLTGSSRRTIANRFGISDSSIQRRKPHVAPIVARAFERREDRFGDNLVEELRRLAMTAAQTGAEAKKAKQYGAAMGGVREMTRICELIAKLTGQLDEGTRVNASSPNATSARPGRRPATADARRAARVAALAN
jgi:hypothetical protein